MKKILLFALVITLASCSSKNKQDAPNTTDIKSDTSLNIQTQDSQIISDSTDTASYIIDDEIAIDMDDPK